MPLKEARDWLRERLGNGARCPCCTQMAKVYWRPINTGMAQSAIRLYRWQREHPGQFAHLPTVLGRRSAEEAKLRYWGLVEEEASLRPDGGRTGYWRLTEPGVALVRGQLKVPRYVRVYDGRALGPPQPAGKSGEPRPDVTIIAALGTDFDYHALMRGES